MRYDHPTLIEGPRASVAITNHNGGTSDKSNTGCQDGNQTARSSNGAYEVDE